MTKTYRATSLEDVAKMLDAKAKRDEDYSKTFSVEVLISLYVGSAIAFREAAAILRDTELVVPTSAPPEPERTPV